MAITFPEARDGVVKLCELLAAWIKYCELNFPGSDWWTFIMPINPRNEAIPIHPGFDELCRVLVGNRYQRTRQPTEKFFEENRCHLEKLENAALNPNTGRSVNGVRLTQSAVEHWNSKEDKESLLIRAERMLQADQEDDEGNVVSGDAPADSEPESGGGIQAIATQQPPHPLIDGQSFKDICAYFVEVIQEKDFQAFQHGRRPAPTAVRREGGWQQRHDSYFWPNPEHDIERNANGVASLVGRFRPLLEKVDPNQFGAEMEGVWDRHDQATAVELAEDVFDWGGLHRIRPTRENTFEVIINAAACRTIYANAPMNSGWTKVAAFASEAAGVPKVQAIWDSRVSTAVVMNLDSFVNPRECDVIEIRDLRMILGRGGFRPARQEVLWARGWPSRWGTTAQAWQTHFAGAKFIRTIRDILNDNLRKFGKPRGAATWSVRAVEMALFMEGY